MTQEKQAILMRIEELLNEVRPFLLEDGGNCELVDITDDGIVQLRLVGACGSCPSSTYTLQQGIGTFLKEHMSAVKGVEKV